MRESTRAEVRHIAGAIAGETVVRYSDALARSPYARQTMETTARSVATEVARGIADERVAHAQEIVRAAASAAGETATETAQRVAEKTAAGVAAELAHRTLEETRSTLESALAEVRGELARQKERAATELAQAREQALSIRSCAFADGMVAAHPDFRLIATANTYGTGGDRQYVGRQALDAATLDRFVVIDVPVDEELEERIALAHAPAREQEARAVIGEVRRLRATAAEKRLPVMFSPRAGIDAAKLLQAGASVEQAIQWRVVRGMSAAHRSALGLATEATDATDAAGAAGAAGPEGDVVGGGAR